MSSIGTCEFAHSSDTWSMEDFASSGKGLLVLAPFVAEGLLPGDVGLDAVAVADVHRGLAREAPARALERGDAPVAHLVEVDVEGGLVELDHVHAQRGQLTRFLVQDLGERHGELLARAVMLVVERVHHRHRPGQRELDRVLGAPSAGTSRRRNEPASGATTGPTTRGTFAS